VATLGKKPAAAPAAKKAPARKTVAPTPGKKPVAKKKAAPARAPAPVFEAPADFKPAFFEVAFSVGEDGLMAPQSLQASRVKGRWDNAEARRYDLREYDVNTLIGIGTRLAYVTYAPNILKRLPANTSYGLVLRVSKRASDGSLAARVVAAKYQLESGKWKWYSDKADPIYRRLRRVSRPLASGFVDVQLPPSGRRSKKSSDESED